MIFIYHGMLQKLFSWFFIIAGSFEINYVTHEIHIDRELVRYFYSLKAPLEVACFYLHPTKYHEAMLDSFLSLQHL